MSRPIIRACIDKYLPGESPAEQPGGGKIAAETERMWKRGTSLKIRFLNGDPYVHQSVIAAAKEWCQYANIYFDFGSYSDAVIRIAFNPGGSWSYIGCDAEKVDPQEPTMNLGWLHRNTARAEVRRVVLHEFGHALGCIHEHQSPAAGIDWNTEFVYQYYKKTNNWEREMVDRNVINQYSGTKTQFTKFDPTSIMVYPITREMTNNGYEAGWNYELSRSDKAEIAKWYPFSAKV